VQIIEKQIDQEAKKTSKTKLKSVKVKQVKQNIG